MPLLHRHYVPHLLAWNAHLAGVFGYFKLPVPRLFFERLGPRTERIVLSDGGSVSLLWSSEDAFLRARSSASLSDTVPRSMRVLPSRQSAMAVHGATSKEVAAWMEVLSFDLFICCLRVILLFDPSTRLVSNR